MAANKERDLLPESIGEEQDGQDSQAEQDNKSLDRKGRASTEPGDELG